MVRACESVWLKDRNYALLREVFTQRLQGKCNLSGMMTGLMWFGAIGIPMIVLGVVALIGGIMALKAKNWGFCLAAAILGIFCGTIFGILGTIFIALRRSEFS